MSVCDVSVVMPAYNAASFIIEALESVARQTRQPKEVLVINDGSSDDTHDVVNKWIKESAHGLTVRLLDQPNSGVAVTRNTGIQQALGTWVALCDADDIWDSSHLEALCEAAACVPDTVLVYGAGRLLHNGEISPVLYDEYWDNPSRLYGIPLENTHCLRLDTSAFGRMMRGNFIKPTSLMFRRETAVDIGLFDVALRSGEDREFLVRLMFKGSFVYTPTPISLYRWHGENLTNPKHAKRNMENGLRVFSKVIGNQSLAMNADQLAACHTELHDAIKSYMYTCARSGLRPYASGLNMVYRLFGAGHALRAVRPKDLVRSAIS